MSADSPFLIVHCEQPTARLRYILDIILGHILGLGWDFQHEESLPEKAYSLHYGTSGPGVRIPRSGLLEESHIRRERPAIEHQEGLPSLFTMETQGPHALAFDLLAAGFYVLTEYETYTDQALDVHGRYRQDGEEISRLELDKYPLLHRYAEHLWDALRVRYPALGPMPKPSYDYAITIDVDFPWKYQHKPWYIQAGGLLKSLLAGRAGDFPERLQALGGRQDPNFTFPELFQLCPPAKTRWFFLLERHSPHDSRFTWRHQAYRRLMQDIASRGFGVGIHPAYRSGLETALIQPQVQALHNLLQHPIRHSRQHFLRYRNPDTFRALIEAGIQADYTACLYQTGGFPHGMAIPFPWFDLERNEATVLLRHPTMIMDRTMQQYMQLSPEEATKQVKRLHASCLKWGGRFTLLIHNDSLSESAEWVGWSDAIRSMIDQIKAPDISQNLHD